MKSIKDATNLTSRDLQAIKRIEQLLESAKQLFVLKGFHATTTGEIKKIKKNILFYSCFMVI